MLCTVPILTPRRVTGAPTARPATELLKYDTTRNLGVKRLRPPNRKTAATASASAPRTKAPTAVDLPAAIDSAPMLRLGRQPLAMHEGVYGRVFVFVKHAFRGASGDHGLRPSIKKNPIIANSQQTGQFMADHNHRDAKTIAQLQNEIVESPGGDRIEAG